MRAALRTESTPRDGEEPQPQKSIILDSRQIRAVIDCLDSFCELHPSFGLKEPTVEVQKTSMLQRLAATLNAGMF